MSAQGYWNSDYGNDHQQQQSNYPQQGYQQGEYNSSHNQDHSYQEHQQPPHGRDGEQMNWGYGSGNQQTHHLYEQNTPANYNDGYQPPSHAYNQYPNYDENPSYHRSSSYMHNQSYDNDSYRSSVPEPSGAQAPTHSYSAGNDSLQTTAPTYTHAAGDNQRYSTAENQYTSHGYSSFDDSAGHVTRPYGIASHSAQGPPGPNGERGLLGAIGGAAAGGYAGHKVNHGFIGALGGAYAGHKLEDKVKDKKKKKDKTKYGSGRRSSSSSSSSSSDDEKKKKKKYGAAAAGAGIAGAAYGGGHHGGSHANAVLAGNFSSSSTQMSLDRDYDLIASCATVTGSQKLSSISLDSCIGNTWGEFQWSRGGGFTQSSRNIKLVDGGRVLEAELNNGHGGWNLRRLNLNERITNVDGDLQFLN